MNILDIAIAKKLAGGGGGSGTDNYNDLSNLPKINDTTLSGNKSSSALGLQSEINSDSKLASDLVDDTNQDNKFVTSTEKQTWNNKQNAIDSDHKLSSSLVSFTTAEAAALASGIDSSKVGQISTNQTNILYGLNTGVKNWFVVPNGNYSSSAGGAESTWEFTDGACKVIKCTSNDTRAAFNIAEIKLPAGDYVMTGRHLVNGACDVRLFKDGTNITTSDVSRFTLSTESVVEVAAYTYGTASVGTILKPLLCTAEAYAQSTAYQPPALPNYDLTRLESEDRASLAEVVDSGAKNLAPTASIVKTTTTPSFTPVNLCSFPAGTYHVKFDYTMGNVGTFCLKKSDASTTLLNLPTLIPKGTGTYEADFTINEACGGYNIYGENTANLSNIMICTKAAFGVSSKFAPYRLNYDLVCQNIKDVNTVLEAVL